MPTLHQITLGELLTSNDPTITRHARGILAALLKRQSAAYAQQDAALDIKPTVKPHYLACIWCGQDIPKSKPYAKYCSEKCSMEAVNRR
jgi:hypothetical protein